MEFIINEMNRQIDNKKMNIKDLNNLNSFFMALNNLNKGTNDTLIKVSFKDIPIDSYLKKGIVRYEFKVYTNLLSDEMTLYSKIEFKTLLKEYLGGFLDNKELLYDIFKLMLEYGIIKFNDSLRLVLFNRLYNSGFFCYTCLNGLEFLDTFNYYWFDYNLMSNIVSKKTISEMELEFQAILIEFYSFNDNTLDIEFKDCFI